MAELQSGLAKGTSTDPTIRQDPASKKLDEELKYVTICLFPEDKVITSISLQNDRVIAVRVGNDQKPVVFYLHKRLLCEASDFFATALQQDQFQEGCEGVVCLPTQYYKIVSSFAHWLYTKNLAHSIVQDTGNARHLIYLHLFADKYLISELKRTVLGHIFDLLLRRRTISLPSLSLAYSRTLDGSSLRRLFSDFIGSVAPTQMIRDHYASMFLECPDFARDITVVLTKRCDNPVHPFHPGEKEKAAYLDSLEHGTKPSEACEN